MAPKSDSSTFPVDQDTSALPRHHPGAVDPTQPVDPELAGLDQERIARDAFETKVKAFILSLEPAEQLALWRLFHGMHPRLILAPPNGPEVAYKPVRGGTAGIMGPSEGSLGSVAWLLARNDCGCRGLVLSPVRTYVLYSTSWRGWLHAAAAAGRSPWGTEPGRSTTTAEMTAGGCPALR
jgi:hypothetical protein